MRRKSLVIAISMALLLGTGTFPRTDVEAAPDYLLDRGWVHAPVQGIGGSDFKCCGPSIQSVATPTGFYLFLPGGTNSRTLWRSPNGTTWTQIPLDPATFRSTDYVGTLTTAGGHLFLQGNTESMSQSPHALLWVSEDGVTWRRSQEDPFGSQEAPRGIVAGGVGLVAAGNHVWTSADGLTWDQVPDPDHVFADAHISSVARGVTDLVAVGYVSPGDRYGGPAVWTSRDGYAWQRVALPASVTAPEGHTTSMLHIIAGPGGFLVTGAISASDPGANENDALWASADGEHWQMASPAPFQDRNTYDQPEQHIVPLDTGFVAMDWTEDEAILWSSPDGVIWSRVGGDEIFGGSTHMSALVATGTKLVGFGSFGPVPEAACGQRGDPLPSPSYGAFVWTPEQSQTAGAPQIDPTSPKRLRLRVAVLLPPYTAYPGVAVRMSGRWLNLCDRLPELGLHRAYGYSLYLVPRAYIDGITVTTSHATAARRAFPHVTPLFVLPASTDTDARTIGTSKRVHASLHIGDQTRLFSMKIRNRVCDDGDCGIIVYAAYVVVWRKGAVIGGVVVENSRSIAVALARKQLQHLQNSHSVGRNVSLLRQEFRPGLLQ